MPVLKLSSLTMYTLLKMLKFMGKGVTHSKTKKQRYPYVCSTILRIHADLTSMALAVDRKLLKPFHN